MARPHHDRQRVEAEVAGLGDLTVPALRARWETLFGHPPPQALRRDFLVRACAHQLQIRAFGGLSAVTTRRLKAIAETVRRGKPLTGGSRIKPGTRFVRSYGGKVRTVTALDPGFEYEGTRYRSLSAIATAITGTNWNGNTFFGVKKTASLHAPNKNAGLRNKSCDGPAQAPDVGRGGATGGDVAVQAASATLAAVRAPEPAPKAPAQMEMFV